MKDARVFFLLRKVQLLPHSHGISLRIMEIPHIDLSLHQIRGCYSSTENVAEVDQSTESVNEIADCQQTGILRIRTCLTLIC